MKNFLLKEDKFNRGRDSYIAVKGDLVREANETFFVKLSAATNATIADAQGLGTITNDD